MNKYYLTENIYVENNKYYYNDKLVNNNNWHIFLSEIGWEKLPVSFIKILNKLSDIKLKNSPYGVIDCGDDGNCLYSCIASAFNFNNNNLNLNAQSIRDTIADNLTEDYYNNIISIYRCLKECDDFDEEWDPCNINTLDDFKNIIKNSKNEYWADHICIQLIEQFFNINIIIIDNCKLYNKASDNISKNNIILNYVNSNHFQLIGKFKDNNMITIFNNIPVEIIKLK